MEMIVPTSPSVDATGRYRAAVPQAAPRAMRPPRPKPRSGEFYWGRKFMRFLGRLIEFLINEL